MQFDMFKPAACANVALAASFTGGDKSVDKNRRARSVANVGIKYGSDNVKSFGVHHTGKDLSGGELTKKRGGAIGMREGWREVLNEPVRQRVGLLQMSAHYNVER